MVILVAIQQIAGVLPAIKVGPGMHTLSYTYTPTSVLPGALLAAIGFLAALTWLIAGRFFVSGKSPLKLLKKAAIAPTDAHQPEAPVP